jgi:hypothetical protein
MGPGQIGRANEELTNETQTPRRVSVGDPGIMTAVNFSNATCKSVNLSAFSRVQFGF